MEITPQNQNKDEKTPFPQKRGSNFIVRLILFAVALPAIIALIFLAPEAYLWPLNAVLILIAVPSAFEAARLFGMNPRKTLPRTIGVTLNGLGMPTVAFLWVTGVIQTRMLFPVYTAMAMAILFIQVFRQQNKVKKISPGIGKHLAVLAYPGLLMSHLIMITALPNASLLYMVFIAGVFSNDTMAYVGGRLFGRRSIHPVPISPNKSLVGFITGYIFSIIGILVVYFIDNASFPGGLPAALTMGALVGLTTIVGDLIESGLKRSAKQKDSGIAIPGRGGLLDSLDSILFTAPVFFYAYQLLNGIWVI